jgi:RuvB-like protein 1 (pontin 52)
MIIRTLQYSLAEIMHILSIRANIEGINIEEEALSHLAKTGTQTSLR